MMTYRNNPLRVWMGGALFAFTAALAMAQQAEVGLRMEVDKRQVQVGENLTLTLEFKQVGSGNSSVMGEPQISTPEHFEIRGQTSSTQVNMINQQTMAISTTRLELTATKPGTETLGPALLIYQDASGKKQEIKSNVATVTVVEKSGFSLFGKKSAPAPPPANQTAPPPPQAPADDLRDVKPLLPESNMVIKALIALLLLGLVAGFIWRQLNQPVRGRAALPVGKAALLKDAWKKLSNEELSGKEFCLGLSNLVRECLQYRFGFPAVDYTTEEILKELKKFKITDDEFVSAEKCLKTCDRVLYADGNLTGRDNLRSLAQALLPKAPKNS
ncbi:MAG TPA: BatD family protein [bacterium]|nr:BatD family protein [bacterium]